MSIFGKREGGGGGGGGGGLRAKVWHLNFLEFFGQIPHPWDWKIVPIQKNISLSAFKKTAVWGKICGQNPQDWDKGSVQMSHLCRTPHLRLNVFVPASQGCAVAEPGGRRFPTFALG